MKKSLIFCAALLACAFSFQSCDKVDNPSGTGPTEAVIDNGMDLAEVATKFADANGVVTEGPEQVLRDIAQSQRGQTQGTGNILQIIPH